MNVKKCNILIIDDDKNFILDIKNMLSGIEFDIDFDEGYSENDFYDLFEPDKYNAVILDLKLKIGYEGLELLRYGIENDPNAQIIILTGYETTKTAIEALQLGAKDYLEKKDLIVNKEAFINKFQKRIKSMIIDDKARRSIEEKEFNITVHIANLLNNKKHTFEGFEGLDKVLAEITLIFLQKALVRSDWKKLDAYKYLGYDISKRGTLNKKIIGYFDEYEEFRKKYEKLYGWYN